MRGFHWQATNDNHCLWHISSCIIYFLLSIYGSIVWSYNMKCIEHSVFIFINSTDTFTKWNKNNPIFDHWIALYVFGNLKQMYHLSRWFISYAKSHTSYYNWYIHFMFHFAIGHIRSLEYQFSCIISTYFRCHAASLSFLLFFLLY